MFTFVVVPAYISRYKQGDRPPAYVLRTESPDSIMLFIDKRKSTDLMLAYIAKRLNGTWAPNGPEELNEFVRDIIVEAWISYGG